MRVVFRWMKYIMGIPFERGQTLTQFYTPKINKKTQTYMCDVRRFWHLPGDALSGSCL